MPDGGYLTIETANAHVDDAYSAEHAEVTPGQYVLLAVSDTGGGMTAEVQSVPLSRTSSPSPRANELGLVSAKSMDSSGMGGHIQLYNEVSCGLTVKLYLPRHSGADDQDTTGWYASTILQPHNRELILVVEDLPTWLIDLGYQTIYASDSVSALAELQRQPDIAPTTALLV